MLTEFQQQLYEALLSYPRTEAAKKVQKQSPMEFVIRHGWWYEPCEVPDDIDREPSKSAIRTPTSRKRPRLADILRGLRPLRKRFSARPARLGYGRDRQGHRHHLGQDRRCLRWRAVQNVFIRLTCLKNKAHISLLDDWMNDYPLFNGLGETPETWLETVLGNGAARLRPIGEGDHLPVLLEMAWPAFKEKGWSGIRIHCHDHPCPARNRSHFRVLAPAFDRCFRSRRAWPRRSSGT